MIRTLLALVATLAIYSLANATPITYSFTGTLQETLVPGGSVPLTQGPLNFNGTFFYDSSVPARALASVSTPAPGGPTGDFIGTYEDRAAGITPGTDFGMTLHLGGSTYTTNNNTFWDQFNIDYGKYGTNLSGTFVLLNPGGGAGFSITLSNAAPVLSNIIPPPNPDSFTGGAVHVGLDGGWEKVGILTSLELVPATEVPEPASLLAYAVGCIGLAATRRSLRCRVRR